MTYKKLIRKYFTIVATLDNGKSRTSDRKEKKERSYPAKSKERETKNSNNALKIFSFPHFFEPKKGTSTEKKFNTFEYAYLILLLTKCTRRTIILRMVEIIGDLITAFLGLLKKGELDQVVRHAQEA